MWWVTTLSLAVTYLLALESLPTFFFESLSSRFTAKQTQTGPVNGMQVHYHCLGL